MFIDCIKQSPVEIPRLPLRDHLKINRRAQAQNSNQTKIPSVSEFMFFFFLKRRNSDAYELRL